MKQKQYDVELDTVNLEIVNISKACAKQRTGRCGRTQHGISYRLYTKKHFDQFMLDFKEPEIKRIPLTEVCLQIQLFNQLPIESFLAKTMNPPPTAHIRKAISTLKQLGALTENECITVLGQRLSELPIECRFGKMILYAMVFRCLKPILIIVSALSTDNFFSFPKKNETMSEHLCKIQALKSIYEHKEFSDHKAFVGLYEKWLETNPNLRSEFCKQNRLTKKVMKFIHDNVELLNQRLQFNFSIPNIKKLSSNSNDWEMVRACLAASMFPQICQIDKEEKSIRPKITTDWCPHMISVVYDPESKGKIKTMESEDQLQWFVYDSKTYSDHMPALLNISFVNAIQVILFSGQTIRQWSDPICVNMKHILINNSIEFILTDTTVNLLLKLRNRIANIMEYFYLKHESFLRDIATNDTVQKTNQLLSKILTKEQIMEIDRPITNNYKYWLLSAMNKNGLYKILSNPTRNWRFNTPSSRLHKIAQEIDTGNLIVFFHNSEKQVIHSVASFIALENRYYEFHFLDDRVDQTSIELCNHIANSEGEIDSETGNRLYQMCLPQQNNN